MVVNSNMTIGITFGAFDLFHAGHILMLEEAKTVCDYLIVGIQTDPTLDRASKNKPVQSIVERQIQVEGCKYVDRTMVYGTEAELEEILKAVIWDVRILGDEYRHKDFTARELCIDKCYFNRRPHTFSSSSLRNRVVENQRPPENIKLPTTTPVS